MQLRTVSKAMVLMALSVLFAACPGRLTDPERFTNGGEGGTVNCASVNVQDSILNTTCGAAGCHNAATKSGGLDTVSPNLAQRMLGQDGTTCPTNVLLNADLTGFFFDIITTTSNISCGSTTVSPMPLGGSALNSTQVACLRQYLGAQLDGGST